jgi:hypothetical protein
MTANDPPDDTNPALYAENIGDFWLTQALLQLVASFGGQAEASISAAIGGLNDQHFGVNFFLARLNGARLSISFSAFAAEAQINRFLERHLSSRDSKTAKNIRPVVERYVVGSKLVLGETLFPRDAAEYQGLQLLFERRNKLVHSSPQLEVQEEVIGAASYRDYNPSSACELLQVAAKSAVILAEASGATESPQLAQQIFDGAVTLQPLANMRAAMAIPSQTEIKTEIAAAVALHPDLFINPTS